MGLPIEGRLLNLLQPFSEQLLLPQVVSHRDCPLNLLTCLGEPSHFREEVSANTVKQMIASQRRVSGERGYGIECIKAGGRPLRHAHSDGPIQCHDGRWRGLHQSVVEKNDPFPVSLFGRSSSRVTGNNRCLQGIVSSAPTESSRLFE